MRLLGKAHGVALYRMALGHDDRPVVAERDAKSVSVEDTFDVDLHDRVRVRTEVERLAGRCVERLRGAGRSGRTVVLKVRRYDFSTLTRSETLRGPTDDPTVVREAAARLLEAVDTTGGVRLLGVGVTGLADFTQEDLFAQAADALQAVSDESEDGADGAPDEPVTDGKRPRSRRTGSQAGGGPQATTYGTTSTGTAGCRAAVSAVSRSGSRNRGSGRAGCARSVSTIRSSSRPIRFPWCGTPWTTPRGRPACRSPCPAPYRPARRSPARNDGRAATPARGRDDGRHRNRGRP